MSDSQSKPQSNPQSNPKLNPKPEPGTDLHSESVHSTIRRLLTSAKRIAIVGASDSPSRVSRAVARYLMQVGYDIVPVNPQYQTVLTLPCFPSLRDVPGPIDLVSVFRRPEFCPDVARDAAAVGDKAIWLQSGIVSDDARNIARAAGMDYIEDHCIMVEHGGIHPETA